MLQLLILYLLLTGYSECATKTVQNISNIEISDEIVQAVNDAVVNENILQMIEIAMRYANAYQQNVTSKLNISEEIKCFFQ